MRDSYPPGAVPNPTEDKFPTPDAIRRRHAALVAPRVHAVVSQIRVAIEARGARECTIRTDVDSDIRDLVREAIEPSGWTVKFESDQYEGSYVTVTPR